jgi:hypothetical protein
VEDEPVVDVAADVVDDHEDAVRRAERRSETCAVCGAAVVWAPLATSRIRICRSHVSAAAEPSGLSAKRRESFGHVPRSQDLQRLCVAHPRLA